MNESPNFLSFAILFGSLIMVALKYRHYKEKSERLEMENIKMATKLGKEIGVCECCGEKMVKNMYNQKYHSACKDQVDVDRIINLYHKTKKKFNKIKSKIVMLRNGLEINTNTIIGKEIANKW